MVFMIIYDYLQIDFVKYLQPPKRIISKITPILDYDNYIHYSDKLFERLDKIV